MYTGLRGTITFTDAALPVVKLVATSDISWRKAAEACGYSNSYAFMDSPKAEFIPRGGAAYLADWDEHYVQLEGNTLRFCCSLKNYYNEIELFLEMLQDMAESYDLQSQYEEAEDFTSYVMARRTHTPNTRHSL
jgi:hypothetical protein